MGGIGGKYIVHNYVIALTLSKMVKYISLKNPYLYVNIYFGSTRHFLIFFVNVSDYLQCTVLVSHIHAYVYVQYIRCENRKYVYAVSNTLYPLSSFKSRESMVFILCKSIIYYLILGTLCFFF